MTSRVQALPRRVWRDRAADAVPALTQALRTPHGAQTLFPIQAVSLLELWERGGCWCNARVGSGKTIISGLASTLMSLKGFSRPLLVVPASLREKTETEFRAAREHWQIAHQYQLESYTALAQVSRADLLDEYQPDGLIFDEPDPLRRLNASAVAKRVRRYIRSRREANLPLWCLFLTGTPDRDAITDYAHMIHWALGDGAPFPVAGADLEWSELQSWSAWLDKGERAESGAFRKYFPAAGVPGAGLDAPEAERDRDNDLYCDRLIHTPGVIVSDDSFNDAELRVSVYHQDPGLEKEFEMLRTLWLRPDGWDLLDADPDPKSQDEANTFSIWGVARQLALGFFYVPDPEPPKEWLAARKAWARYVKLLIDAQGSRYDTPKQVENAAVRAIANGGKVLEWSNWLALRDTFTPGKRPEWLSDHAIEAAASWGSQAPGLVWTDHIAFAHRLAQRTGWTYYGQKGLSSAGRSVEAEDGKRTVIVSRAANHRGRNLQFAFSRSLITAMPNAARDVEQLLGRTHRYGQRERIVTADILATCTEHVRALDRVGERAAVSNRQTRLTQKWLSVEVAVRNEQPTGWAFK